jgi:hypothetical protein
MGVDIESESNDLLNAKESGFFDTLSAKLSALRLCTHAALTILSVDQVCFIILILDHHE